MLCGNNDCNHHYLVSAVLYSMDHHILIHGFCRYKSSGDEDAKDYGRARR